MLLTEAKIRRVVPRPGERLDLSDGGGLTLRCSPSGRRVWSLSFRVAEAGPLDPNLGRARAGAKQRRTLGYYPSMGLTQARAVAATVRAQALAGTLADPTPLAASLTVQALIQRYCAAKQTKRILDVQSLLLRHVGSKWGDRLITDLVRGDLVNLLRPLSPAQQFEVRKNVAAMFNWAVAEDLLPQSPFAGVRLRERPEPRERCLTMAEVREAYRVAPEVGEPFGALYRLLLLTGCRLREIAHARREWIEGETLVIPAGMTKTRKAHVVPLSAEALSVLAGLTPHSAGSYLFSTTEGRSPVSGFSKAKTRLDGLMPPGTEPFVVHDFRRTIRSHLSRLGVDAVTAEMILGHQMRGVMGVYDRYDRLAERRAALSAWAEALV